jgi:hypothetical protein
LASSSDPFAQSWTPLGKTLFSNIYCVKWLLGKWFAGADASGSCTMASSPDAASWIYVSNSVLTTNCRSISWNGREVVATGSGSSAVSISSDGITWTSVAGLSNANCAEWNGREWIIVGNSVNTGISTSTPGTITTFSSTAASSLLTTFYCVGANSCVGAFVPNNRLYMNAGERLTVYGPAAYDGSITQDTSISLNMNLPV